MESGVGSLCPEMSLSCSLWGQRSISCIKMLQTEPLIKLFFLFPDQRWTFRIKRSWSAVFIRSIWFSFMFRVFSAVKEVSEFNESLQRDEELQSSRSFLMGLKVKTRLFDDGDTRFPPDQTGALKSSYLLVSVNTSNTFMCALPVKIKHSWGWGCAGVLWLDHTPLCTVSLFELVFILNDGEVTAHRPKSPQHQHVRYKWANFDFLSSLSAKYMKRAKTGRLWRDFCAG